MRECSAKTPERVRHHLFVAESLERSLLTWKVEHPSEDGVAEDDVGSAWVDGNGSGSYPSGPVAGGSWLTRGEARAIADEHGFTFVEDDGRPSFGSPQGESGIDVAGMNRKLRAAGVSAAELRIEESPFGDLKLWGTMLQQLPSLQRQADSPFTTAMISMSPEDALEALDRLVPGWRSAD